MKILQRFWPWKRILDLERRLRESNEALVKLQAKHEASSKEHAASRDGLRKMARILEMRGFDRTITTIAFLLACFSVVGQPLQRQLFTTNPPPLLSSISGPFVSTNGSGLPVLTYNGGQLTNVGVSVNINSNAVAVTNGQLVTISGVTDTNAVNGLIGNATNGAINNLTNYLKQVDLNITNQGTVVSNGVVAHTVTVAGTANQISSSVGTAQQLANNPSTTLSLPNPLIAPGVVSVNGFTNQAESGAIGVVTNDINGKNGSSATLPSALFPALSGIISTASGSTATYSSGTWTNAIDSTNATITGTFQVYGDKFRTNGVSVSSGGEVLSNNLGKVIISSGNIQASGLSASQFVGTDSGNPAKLVSTLNGGTLTNLQTLAPALSNSFGIRSITFAMDGGGQVIGSTKYAWASVTCAGTLLSARILADTSSSLGFDVWKTNFNQFPPLIANTIVASAAPAMTTAVKYQDSTLTGWQKSFVSNDVFWAVLNSNSAATKITLNLDYIAQ